MTETSTTDGMGPKMAAMTAVALFVGLGLAYVFHISDRPVAQHVPAEPYSWPSGCKPAGAAYDTGKPNLARYYRVMGEIPKSCMDPEYYIADPGNYGLKGLKGIGRNYYRVGPDAINIDCHSDGICVVVHIERDVFSESGHSGE
jgi:hypothetical protein